MVAQGGDGKPQRRKRHHKLRQLVSRPVTLDSCLGPVVVSATIRDGVPWVQIEAPADVPVTQPLQLTKHKESDND